MSDGAITGITLGSIAFYFAMVIATYEARRSWLAAHSGCTKAFYDAEGAAAGIFWPITLVWFIGYLVGRILFKVVKNA